jgi:RNA polymerase sigma factor (TIGR02999 family)
VESPASGAAGTITRLLIEWRNGDAEAVNRLVPLLYSDLRAMARHHIRRSGRRQTLDTTSLVHEAYVKLVDGRSAGVNDRNHFFALASKTMRHILVDHARARAALKRGAGDLETLSADDAELAGLIHGSELGSGDDRAAEILGVDEALRKLGRLDPRLVEIVELRFFGGLSVEEAAGVLGLSARTLKRDWQKARAFLLLQLSAETP